MTATSKVVKGKRPRTTHFSTQICVTGKTFGHSDTKIAVTTKPADTLSSLSKSLIIPPKLTQLEPSKLEKLSKSNTIKQETCQLDTNIKPATTLTGIGGSNATITMHSTVIPITDVDLSTFSPNPCFRKVPPKKKKRPASNNIPHGDPIISNVRSIRKRNINATDAKDLIIGTDGRVIGHKVTTSSGHKITTSNIATGRSDINTIGSTSTTDLNSQIPIASNSLLISPEKTKQTNKLTILENTLVTRLDQSLSSKTVRVITPLGSNMNKKRQEGYKVFKLDNMPVESDVRRSGPIVVLTGYKGVTTENLNKNATETSSSDETIKEL